MTNKSKELAVLLGIKPKKQIEIECFNECCDCPSYKTENGCGELYYPDFEAPENFVKLLNIVCTGFGDVEDGYILRTQNPVKELIDDHIVYLQSEDVCELYKENIDLLKTEAQKTGWVY